ncbi:MAG: DinB family protein [Chloroflexi bacterium]|nr:DinB family protein [Chloroflexota bacterium]
MTDRPDEGERDDPLLSVDPWTALQDGRAQLLRAIDALTAEAAVRALANAPGWSIADALTHLAAWDELTGRFLRALAAGARDLPVEAAPEDEWAAWNAAQIAAARDAPLAARVERLHDARAELFAAAAAIDLALFDEPFATPWGTRDTVRAYLVGQAMHDGMHAESLT